MAAAVGQATSEPGWAQLIADAAGKAYVGVGSSGRVMVVSPDGHVLASLKTGRNQEGSSPFFELGPSGQLVVSGPNGTTRVYT